MIAAFVPDLMDRSRFGGVEVRFVRTPADARTADLVVVDLDRCEDVEGFGALAGRGIAFGSHVDDDRMARGRAAGFDEVLARSVFFRRLPDLLSEGDRGAPEAG